VAVPRRNKQPKKISLVESMRPYAVPYMAFHEPRYQMLRPRPAAKRDATLILASRENRWLTFARKSKSVAFFVRSSRYGRPPIHAAVAREGIKVKPIRSERSAIREAE